MDTKQQVADVVQEVIKAEREWVEAHRRLDIAALDRLMAEEYKHIRSDGAVAGKAEDLASYQTGDRHWDFAESDEYDVQVYGQTAVGRWSSPSRRRCRERGSRGAEGQGSRGAVKI